ncbi:MAG: hypothetical protein HOO86_07930 [Bacteroidales bacterium]|nr:hypothetical protein [Bacteroidales bacterium]
MKKINLLLLLVFVTGSVLMTSCSKDETIVDQHPTINLKGGAGYTSTDVTINTDEQIKFGIIANYNASSKEKIKNVKITLTSNNTPQTLVDSTLNAVSFDTDYFLSFSAAGTIKLVATVTDADGLTAETGFDITVEQVGVTVKKKTNIELGSSNDTFGSYYSVTEELVYTVADANQNQAKIDFGFYKGAANANTIASPDDADLNTVYHNDSWTTKNQTRFIMTAMTVAEFDAIADLYVFPEFVDANASSEIINLVNDKVLYFKTQAGKRGYIKITELYLRGDVAKIDVIAEQ